MVGSGLLKLLPLVVVELLPLVVPQLPQLAHLPPPPDWAEWAEWADLALPGRLLTNQESSGGKMPLSPATTKQKLVYALPFIRNQEIWNHFGQTQHVSLRRN